MRSCKPLSETCLLGRRSFQEGFSAFDQHKASGQMRQKGLHRTAGICLTSTHRIVQVGLCFFHHVLKLLALEEVLLGQGREPFLMEPWSKWMSSHHVVIATQNQKMSVTVPKRGANRSREAQELCGAPSTQLNPVSRALWDAPRWYQGHLSSQPGGRLRCSKHLSLPQRLQDSPLGCFAPQDSNSIAVPPSATHHSGTYVC